MVKIHELPIEYYIDRLIKPSRNKNDRPFSLVGYGDAEWFCVLKHQLGNTTSLGQVIDEPAGNKLLDILKRRQADPNFLFSTPKCIWGRANFVDGEIDQSIESILESQGIQVEFYERDMMNDELAEHAGLYPWIDYIRSVDTILIGNEELAGRLDFLKCDQFLGIPSPNLHLQEEKIDEIVHKLLAQNISALYLVSAGISAPLIIDRLYEWMGHHSAFIDCGSIWDAFAGIGGQREWRARLYDIPNKLDQWKRANLREYYSV